MGVPEKRTSFGIKLVLGLPPARKKLSPFVAEPFQFTWRSTNRVSGQDRDKVEQKSAPKHPICQVLEWQNQLLVKKSLTRVQIAEREGLSKSRMTQMFRMLNLPREARTYLSRLTNPNLIKAFSVRQLTEIARLSASEMDAAFQQLKVSCERSL